MNTNSITDIFFDLDHTLWDFERNSGLTFGYIFSKHQFQIGLETFLETYSPINREYWALYRQEKIAKSALRFQRLNDTFVALDLDVPREIVEKLAEDYIVHLANYNHLFPETLETLDYLEGHYKLHIITNGFAEVQGRKLRNSKIADYFETVTTSDEVGVKKPHPHIFETALGKAGAKKENSVMVGDNLEADIFGAEQSGLQSIFFEPDSLSKEAHGGKKIRAIGELKQLF